MRQLTEIEFKNKIDRLYLQIDQQREDIEHDFTFGYEIYESVKALHLVVGRMRRQIERKMRENGTA